MWMSDSIEFYFYVCFAVVGIWGIAQAWISQSRTETIHPFKSFVHLLAFYLSYLLFPLFFFSLYAGWIKIFSLHESIFDIPNTDAFNSSTAIVEANPVKHGNKEIMPTQC